MNYSVRFHTEKRNGITANVPVILSVTFSKQRMLFYTGLRCRIDENKNQWDSDNCRLKLNQVTPDGLTSQKFNDELSKFSLAVGELFKRYEFNKVSPTVALLRNDLKRYLGKVVKAENKDDFFSRFDQYIREAYLSDNTRIGLTSTKEKLKLFRPETTFNSFDVQYLTDFQNFLLNDKGLSKNTTIAQLNRLRSFLNHANKNGYTDKYPFKAFNPGSEKYGNPVYISVEERDKLYNAVLEDPIHSMVRDIFVFQSLVGCRVSDLERLRKSNIINGCVQYIAQKTKNETIVTANIPLTAKAKEILSRYDLPNGRILPHIDLHLYNEKLKEIFKLDKIKITRIVTVADPKTRENVQKSIADLASSHMARKIFIGGLHKKGVKNELIGSMSGHVVNSKAFSRYYQIDQADQEQAMKLIE